MTAPEKCQARIWPSWASAWITCNQPIVNGECARYGHKPEPQPQPDSVTAPSPSNQQRAAELAEALNTHPEAWVVHRALPVVLAAEARGRAEAAAKIREIADDLDSYAHDRGRPAPGSYDHGLSMAQRATATDLRVLAADLTAPADRSQP